MKYNKNEVTGKMRDRIILQNVNRSRSLTGFASESWADTATIWAFAESKLPGSNETIIDGKNTAKNVCDFTIRYISTITEESRVVWGDKLYQVKNLKVSHDRRFISFQGIFYDSYILTGVNVAASVTGIATTSANLKLIMSVIGQANAIASAIGEITTAQQGLVEVASSVVANGTSTANVTKVIPINSSVAASANVSGAATIVQYVASSVNAQGISIADALLTKTFTTNVNANATATSAIDVISQGLVTFDASVTATGTVTADILRIATLQSSATTTADTFAIASLTKVLEASATATAQTSSNAQLTLAVNAAATTTAVTSADAQLSYTVNAAADATAQTNADAFITRIISADATATANSSAEAGIGVTFVAAAVASASVTSASVLRTATIAASVTAQGTTSAALTLADNVAASVSAAATVSATLTSSSAVDADATAFFLRVTTAGGSLNATEQTAIDTLVKSLKANGIWSKMSAIYPMVGSSAAACRQNLKSASFTGTFSAGWTFASTGATPNGTSAYMDTQFNSFVELVTGNGHYSYYSRTNSGTANSCTMGATDDVGGRGRLILRRDSDLAFMDLGTTGACANSFVSTNSLCYAIITVLSNSNLAFYRNGILQTASVLATNANFSNNNVSLGASVPSSQFDNKQCAFASIGTGLTATEATNLNTSVQTFQTSLSRNV